MTDVTNLQRIRQQLAAIVGEDNVLATNIPVEYTRDFGNQVTKTPWLVVKTHCESALISTVSLLKVLDIPFRIRGKAHSSGGYTLTNQVVIIHTTGEPASLEFLGVDQVRLPASCTWAFVLQLLHAAGVTVPVLTSHLGTTVGGTLSAGGYGIRSVSMGAQVDHVVSVRVIRPDGELITYFPENPLFRHILTGMGQAEVIESVVMRVQPFYRYTKLFSFQLPTLSDVAATLANIPWEVFQTLTVTWAEYDGSETWVTIGTEHTNQFSAVVAPLPPVFSQMKPTRTLLELTSSLYLFDDSPESTASRSVHCWSDFGMAVTTFKDYLTFLTESILPVCKSILNRVYILPIRSNAADLSFAFDLREPGSQTMTFGVGVYLTANTEAEIQTALWARTQMLQFIQERKGRPYLPGFPEADRAKLHPAYASAMQDYRQHYPEVVKTCEH